MKTRVNSVVAVLTVVLMTVIGLTSTANAQVVRSPVVSYFYQSIGTTIYVSGSNHGQNPSFVAKVTFDFDAPPMIEKIVTPTLEPMNKDDPGSQSIRDLEVTSEGSVRLLVGTFKPKILSYDGKTWKTTMDSFTDWALQHNGSAGGFTSSSEGVLYLPGMWTVHSRQGIFTRSSSGEEISFVSQVFNPIDLCYRDGVIYAVEDAQDSNVVWLIDAETGRVKKKVPLPVGDHRAIAVAKDGSIFVADWSGHVAHIDPEGKQLAQTTLKAYTAGDKTLRPLRLNDIDLSPDGMNLAIGTADGYAGILTADLRKDLFYRFESFGFNTFVAWPPAKK